VQCQDLNQSELIVDAAARTYQMTHSSVIIDEITRGAIEGGRDAIDWYLLGLPDDPEYAEFSLEAKCYRPPINGEPPNTVGVKEISRLISRSRHRQFGALVTRSLVARLSKVEQHAEKRCAT
jgi:hypothetical protein